ncbi:alpha-amylase family protein [Granulicella arctica]|uniref:alpha-amylase family protein n=1 Tax=Granulicella arctica TaxID=940613 RepID=UPI0021DF4A9D|nr:beta-galactosidase trimerization domain-containing protein [Granulicella arctica]
MASTRRVFLAQATGLTGASMFGLGFEREALAGGTGAGDWYGQPMRWAQVAFVDDDPGNYSLSFWMDYLKRLHVDAACLSAGGVTAFYPTEIPLHHRSAWLGSMDSFGEIAAGCRKLGMNVVARTDAHACHQNAYDAHPEWIAVDAKGMKRKHPSDPTLWITCALGPYNFDFMTLVHEEITRNYKIDGLFTNRWAGSGMCYCESCETKFHEFSGSSLPRTSNPQDPARREYIVWRQQRLFELWRLWNVKIRAINPGASYIANAGGGALSDLDMKAIGELSPTLFADRQGRSGLMPLWENGKNGKEYRATMGNKAIVGIFSVGIESKYRWKDSVENGNELRLWVADGIANDLRPWFTKFNAKVIDKRWMPVVEEIYAWHYANERYLRNERSLAQVGLVYSQQTATFYGGEKAQEKVENPLLGMYQALIEARIPFAMVHDQLLDLDLIRRYRTLLLPNIAALSTRQCTQIQNFVEQGGSVVATYETSLYDEWGVRRKNFGLASLFGVSFAGKTEGPMLNSYLELTKDPATGQFHPVLTGFEDAVRIIDGINRVVVTPAGPSASAPLQLVPSYPDLPMEAVYPRPVSNPEAAVYLREVGKGRVVYFPADIDATFWDSLQLDHAKLLRNAIVWATNQTAPVTVMGHGVIDVTAWQQKDSMTVHLVNLTNAMMMKGPVREILPIGQQTVSISLPAGKRVTSVKLLVSGSSAPHRMEEGRLLVEVHKVEVHEVVALDLAQ